MRWKQTYYSERLLAQQTTSSPGEREKPLKRGSKKSSQMALPEIKIDDTYVIQNKFERNS